MWGDESAGGGQSEGILYLLCRRLFVYIPRTGNGDGPFDMSPLAKMLRDKRGKTLGHVHPSSAKESSGLRVIGRNGFSRPLKTP